MNARAWPVLGAHGGVLQRRLRGHDGQPEIHLAWFPSTAPFDRCPADLRRARHAPGGSGATLKALRLHDLP